MGIELGKLPVDRGVKEGLFHVQVPQGKPLLHAVNAQHGLQGKWQAAVLAFVVIRGNEFNQGSPRNHAFHLGLQFLLAGSLDTQVQVKATLLHGIRGCHSRLICTKHAGRFCRISHSQHVDADFGGSFHLRVFILNKTRRSFRVSKSNLRKLWKNNHKD